MRVMLNHPEFANPVLSEEETRSLFAPHAPTIAALINRVWKQWESCPQRSMLDARTRASFLSSLFRHEIKNVFGGSDKSGVHFTEDGNSFFLYFGDQAKMRFKKLDANGKYSNIMTRVQLQLIKQVNMPFMPGTYLTIGYQLDALQQGILSKKITLQSRSGVVYAIDLDELASASGKAPNVTPMPQVPPQIDAPRARARKGAVPAKKKKSSGQE
jgi:hypothetical protein